MTIIAKVDKLCHNEPHSCLVRNGDAVGHMAL